MPKKPARKPARNSEARRTNVLLENLVAQFRAFGEGLEALRAEVGSLKLGLEALRSDVDDIKLRFIPLENMRLEFVTFKGALMEVARDLKALKADVGELKTDIKTFIQRLEVVEAKLPS